MVCGDPVKFEFSSADATTAAAVTLYDANGVARPLATGERFVLTDLTGNAAGAAGTVKLLSDNDADAAVDAGETMAVFAGAVGLNFGTEVYAKKNITPKVKAAAAGQVDLVGVGVVIRS